MVITNIDMNIYIYMSETKAVKHRIDREIEIERIKRVGGRWGHFREEPEGLP
jgi:hypothetical protein